MKKRMVASTNPKVIEVVKAGCQKYSANFDADFYRARGGRPAP